MKMVNHDCGAEFFKVIIETEGAGFYVFAHKAENSDLPEFDYWLPEIHRPKNLRSNASAQSQILGLL